MSKKYSDSKSRSTFQSSSYIMLYPILTQILVVDAPIGPAVAHPVQVAPRSTPFRRSWKETEKPYHCPVDLVGGAISPS